MGFFFSLFTPDYDFRPKKPQLQHIHTTRWGLDEIQKHLEPYVNFFLLNLFFFTCLLLNRPFVQLPPPTWHPTRTNWAPKPQDVSPSFSLYIYTVLSLICHYVDHVSVCPTPLPLHPTTTKQSRDAFQ